VVVSTAVQESFGASVVEAMYCDCLPLLPDRLAYPQFIPAPLRGLCRYRSDEELVERLAALCAEPERARSVSLRLEAARYDWSLLSPEYDRRFRALASARR